MVIMKKFFPGLSLVFCILVLIGCNPTAPTQPLQAPIQKPTGTPIAVQTLLPTEPPPATLTPNSTAEKFYATVRLDTGEVLMRTGPGTTYPPTGSLKAGEKLCILAQDPTNMWFLIENPAQSQGKAWVNAALVDLPAGFPPIVDPHDGTPQETPPTQVNAQTALEAIKGYLQRQDIEYQYLGEDVNLNYPQQRVARYRVDWSEFSVELQTNHIVVIDNQNVITQPGPAGQYSPQNLEQMAEDLIARLAPNVDVETLTPEHSNKGDNYFFRWVDPSRSGRPFIQVGYNVEGNLLNYFNALGIE